jgi:hypothetical protein
MGSHYPPFTIAVEATTGEAELRSEPPTMSVKAFTLVASLCLTVVPRGLAA